MPFKSNTSQGGSRVNRRRYARHPVFLSARLKVQGLGTMDCEIRDFCRGGLFLKLGLSAESIPKGQPVEISFSRDSDSSPCTLKGRVVHHTGGGMGIFFVSPPPVGALLALQDHMRRAEASDPPVEHVPSGEGNAVVQACRQALDSLLRPVLDDFFGHVEQSLIAAADRAESDHAQSAFFEAIGLLRENRSRIELGFRASVLSHAENFKPAVLAAESDDKAGEQLALVDRTEFEDWLNLSNEIAKIEDHHAERLQRLEPRLSRLAGEEVNHFNNPYGPGLIERAFRSMVREFPLENTAKRVIYSVFSTALDPRLNELYSRMDDLTRDALPSVREASSPSEAESPEAASPRPSPQEAPRTGERGDAPFKPSALAAAGRILALCSPQGRERSGPAEKSSSAELIQALRILQGRSRERASPYLETRMLEEELARALRDLRGRECELDEGSRQAIETLGAVLDGALQEGFLPTGIGVCIQQLQIPLLAAALADNALITAEHHPARDFLNLLDHLSLATNSAGEIDNAGLRKTLDGLMARLSQEGGASAEVFREAGAQLEKFATPLLRLRAARYQQLQESCEGAHRLAQARVKVEQMIAARLGKGAVSRVLASLLECGWRQLLILALLDEGLEGPTWLSRWAVVENLRAWIKPEGLFPPGVSEVHRLLDFVDDQLLAAGRDAASRDSILGQLEAHLLPAPEPSGARPPLEFVVLPQPAQSTGSFQEFPELSHFRVGDWLKFQMTPERWMPLRLSWVGDAPLDFVFANQKGVKALELGAEEFSRYLRERRAVRIESLEHPLVERTTDRLMQSMQERLRYQASHDPVTELINRKEFIRRVEKLLTEPDLSPSQGLIGLVEIGQLRIVNNLCGTEAGDELLREIGELLARLLGGRDLLARMGDSSFGLLLHGDDTAATAARAEEFMALLTAHHFRWEQRSFSPGVNMGVAPLAGASGEVNVLLMHADAACMAARDRGPNLMQVYTEHDAALAAQTQLMDWAGRIDSLLSGDSLFVRCQRITPLDPSRNLRPHYEALLGIRDEQGQVLPPMEFILAAERWKRISEIDRWQLCSVLDWARQHGDRLDEVGGFSINLSGQSLTSEAFLDFVHEQLSAAEVPTGRITFEITETAAIEDFTHAERFIRQVARYGCKFSLDDFGSGFASYSYLKNLKVRYLKIDGSFVREIVDSATDYALVKSMNEIGHSLGVLTIAEYVENQDILDKLREIGVDYVQGHAIHKAVPLDSLA